MPSYMFKTKRAKEIDKNVAKRQALKKKWDRHCKYGVEDQDLVHGIDTMFSHERDVDFSKQNEENWVRMLDEGTVVDGDGWCYAVIKKGVLKDFFDNLPDDFEGYIDRDHVEAIRLGTYTKKEMRLVSTGDGRHGIDINVKLDDDYYATRDLLKQGEHRAVSVEMGIDFDEFGLADKITGDKSQGKYLVPIINKVNILGYAVCENPKNANSIKDDLLDKASVEGDNMNEEELKKLVQEADTESEQAKDEANQAEENEADSNNAEAPANEDAIKAESNDSEGTEDPKGSEDETAPESEGEENTEEPKEEEEGKSEASEENDKGEEGLEQLGNAIKELRAELAEKDAKIAELEHQLNAKQAATMSQGEAISKLLKLARSSEPNEAESSEVKLTSTNAKSKEAEDDDALWDAAAQSLNY